MDVAKSCVAFFLRDGAVDEATDIILSLHHPAPFLPTTPPSHIPPPTLHTHPSAPLRTQCTPYIHTYIHTYIHPSTHSLHHSCTADNASRAQPADRPARPPPLQSQAGVPPLAEGTGWHARQSAGETFRVCPVLLVVSGLVLSRRRLIGMGGKHGIAETERRILVLPSLLLSRTAPHRLARTRTGWLRALGGQLSGLISLGRFPLGHCRGADQLERRDVFTCWRSGCSHEH
jgi:hypothetical protein